MESIMSEELLQHISECYGTECWERLTGIIWNGNTGYDLWLFQRDVEYDGKNYRCTVIRREWYDHEVSDVDVDYSECIFAEAFVI